MNRLRKIATAWIANITPGIAGSLIAKLTVISIVCVSIGVGNVAVAVAATDREDTVTASRNAATDSRYAAIDLETAIQQALLVSPDVALARLKVIEAQLSLTEARLHQGTTGTLADLLNAEQELSDARMRYMDALKDVAQQVEEAAYQLARQKELLNLREIDLEQAERRLALAKSRFEAGLISALEYAEIEFRRDEARWALKSAQHQFANAKDRLIQLVTGEAGSGAFSLDIEVTWQSKRGLTYDQGLTFDQGLIFEQGSAFNQDLATDQHLALDQVIGEALEASPAVAQAMRSADAAQRQLDLAVKTFASPIEIERAKIERDRANIAVEQARMTLIREVSELYRSVEGLHAQVALKEQALETASRGRDIAVARYQAGQVPLLDVVTAEANSLQARLDLAAAIWDYHAARLRLLRQIGRAELPPLPPEIADFIAEWTD